MSHDFLGNPVSTATAEVIEGINTFVRGFLGYETAVEQIVPLADQFPEALLANIYAGYVWMFLEAADGAIQAEKYLGRAKTLASSGNPRELLSLEVLDAWVSDDIPRAVSVLEQIEEAFPRDLASVKLHQYLEFNQGNSPAMLKAILKVEAQAQDVSYFHGMAAFAYEQCHLLEKAEQSSRRAIQLQRKEPWAQHALAHVLLTQGRIEEGISFLESVRDTWVGLNSFMHTHLWWHLAVFYLSRGKRDKVLEIFDHDVWGISKNYSQDQIGAVQLLTRLELAGFDVGARWEDVAKHIAARGPDVEQPFLSLLYLYGLARVDHPGAVLLLNAIRVQAEQSPAFIRETWAEVALPAAEGLLAYAHKDYGLAAKKLAQALPGLVRIGGSHAQRDLFEQLYLDASLHAGQFLPVQQSYEVRRSGDPRNYQVNAILARVYQSLDLQAEAHRAALAAEELLSEA